MKFSLLFFMCMLALSGCRTTTSKLGLSELPTVSQVDISRYTGTWYEIANITHSFQEGCHSTTATYTQLDDGTLEVVNRCRKDSVDGPESVALGRARVASPNTNAKLKVSFFRPFWGDYWIVELDDDYQYAVVGHPSRDYLWILSRRPEMSESRYDDIVKRLEALGYDSSRFNRTKH